MVNKPCYLPRAAPKAMESLVGQSRVFRFAASPVKEIRKKLKMNINMDKDELKELHVEIRIYRRGDLVGTHWT